MTVQEQNKANNIVTFADGIPGFEEFQQYALVEEEESAPFGTLQSVDREEVGFVLVDPFYFFEDYEFDIPENVVQELNVTTPRSLAIRVIITLQEELNRSTANLVAPIVINTESGSGKQIILTNTSYSTKHTIFSEESEG